MTDYKVGERPNPCVSHKFHISVKGYGYDSHPLDVCMYEEDKRENTNCVGGEWTGDELFTRFDSPYHNAPLIGVCAYCTLLNVNGLTSCYLSGIRSNIIALNKGIFW